MDTTIATATEKTESPFDALRMVRPNGAEFWCARDLMKILGYEKWDRFSDVIAKAQASFTACGIGQAQDDLLPGVGNQNILCNHFHEAEREVIRGNGGAPQYVKDFHLSRYAAYLVAMNGDSRKPEIAAAQHYFVMRTREAEVGTKPKAIAYEDMEPSQLLAMANAAQAQAEAYRSLALSIKQVRDAAAGMSSAMIPQEAKEQSIEPKRLNRIQLAEKYLVPSNLRKTTDGLYWVTTSKDVMHEAWGVSYMNWTDRELKMAAHVLEGLGWEQISVSRGGAFVGGYRKAIFQEVPLSL